MLVAISFGLWGEVNKREGASEDAIIDISLLGYSMVFCRLLVPLLCFISAIRSSLSCKIQNNLEFYLEMAGTLQIYGGI